MKAKITLVITGVLFSCWAVGTLTAQPQGQTGREAVKANKADKADKAPPAARPAAKAAEKPRPAPRAKAVAPGGATTGVFAGGAWIWAWPDAGSNDTLSHPEELVYFRTELTLPPGQAKFKGEAALTADNLFALYVNGRFVGQGHADPNKWNSPVRFALDEVLVPGRNVIAVEAANTAPGPAGMLARVAAQGPDGQSVTLLSDDNWKVNERLEKNWQAPDHNDKNWKKAFVVGPYGTAPWGQFAPDMASMPLQPPSKDKGGKLQWQRGGGGGGGPATVAVSEGEAPQDFAWPDAVAFLGEDCSLYHPHAHTNSPLDSLGVTIFQARKSRAYPEHDLPAPIKIGRKLFTLSPAKPGVQPKCILDAGKGAIGSPSVSFDGKTIYVSMAPENDAFYHIYAVPAAGGQPRKLTDGPFHDIDPVELPDGRIVFTSTRIGTFEEYHNPPSRSLFAMNPDGSDIRAITHTFIFDNEPEVMADGRILFIRSDNFFDRGKVETLLHAVHPDGSEGYTEFGLDLGPEYGGRLRAFYCGSPAPMPDGRVAFLSNVGITVGRPGVPHHDQKHVRIDAGDVAAMPDNRLLATVPRIREIVIPKSNPPRTRKDLSYEKIVVMDPDSRTGKVYVAHDADAPIHSVVHLGARPRPPVLSRRTEPAEEDQPKATGVLFCQDARFTKNTTAGWPHVRAIRVLAGKGLTVRSSHAYIVHAGSEVTELGTVPLAPDGSFAVEVPADTAIAFQAVDAEGRSELNEMSWIFVRPGERRGCLGCHHTRHAAPPPAARGVAQALTTAPLRMTGQGKPLRFRGNNAAVTGLMEMQWDRYREVASITRHSLTPEPLATGAEEIAAQIALLQDKDQALRITAAQRLGIFRDRSAAPGLAAALKDPSREFRVAAATALATCATAQSAPPLIEALCDPEPLVAQAAAVALENLTGRSEPFNGFAPLADRQATARAWGQWLASNRWDQIEADLIARLASTDRDAVRRAAVALGHMGGEPARAALRAYVAKERANNPYPEWRKHHRGDGARFNSLSPANPRTLQEAVRALGHLRDQQAVPMLGETIALNSDSENGNLFLAEACAEALGRIGTEQAQDALVAGLAGLKDYFYYVGWYGDHGALFACHASPVHALIAESLDHCGSVRAAAVIPHLIRSVPTDPDRALLLVTDDCETIVGRVIRRQGAEKAVVETCLSMLGDKDAVKVQAVEEAVKRTYAAWAGKPDPENRAAQILSLVCRDPSYEPRIRAALDRYRSLPKSDMERAFGGGGLPRALPVKNWVCFFLARSLGNLGKPASVDSLLAVLEQCPPELAGGSPPADGAAVLFLHNELTPCYRAAAAWALGRIGERRAVPTLLKVVGEMQNATDTRFAAATALEELKDPTCLPAVRKLAENYPEVSTRKVLLRMADR